MYAYLANEADSNSDANCFVSSNATCETKGFCLLIYRKQKDFLTIW